MDHKQRVANSESTVALLAALKMLEKTNFDAMMGSGIMVRLTPITENKHLADEFCIHAEDMKAIAPLLAESLRQTLNLRKAALMRDAGDIAKALGVDVVAK